MAPDFRITSEPENTLLHSWFAPVLAHGSRWCAPNLDTRCAFLHCGGMELRRTVNGAEWDNSWVCSSFPHFISSAQEQIHSATNPVAAWPVNLLLRGLGAWLHRAHFNRVVMVNNWLMS